MKPFLACDADMDKVKYPVWVLPKIDGVRGLNIKGKLVARSGKPFKNVLNTALFSETLFLGFDGELVLDNVTGERLCNRTTSAMTTIKGDKSVQWWLFDRVVDGVNNEDRYSDRYSALQAYINRIKCDQIDPAVNLLHMVPYKVAFNEQDIVNAEKEYLWEGYEGVILRDPNAPYKYGRSTAASNGFLRVKRFLDAEITVTSITEGKHNGNEAERGVHGNVERSTHQANMVPNGMVGSMTGTLIKDCMYNKQVLYKAGTEIEIAAGKMTHEDRKFYFDNPDKLIGSIVKFKYFPIGNKDKPRFPTFQSMRSEVDM